MEQLDVKILDRDYKLAVNPEEKARLLDAVKMVDERMRTIRGTGRIASVDRVAVMAALQLAHELLEPPPADNAVAPANEVLRKIRKMTDDLDQEIRRQESLF